MAFTNKKNRNEADGHYLEEKPHPWGEAIREIVFGMNDGLISTLGFIAGMSGAVDQKRLIIIAAFAETFAGAVSMSVGAYLSIKAQREFFESEISREKKEIEEVPELEKDELRAIYSEKGFSKSEVEMIVNRLTANKDRWVNAMMCEELHLYPDRFSKPKKVAYFIGISFAAGSLIPIIPVILIHNKHYLLFAITFSVLGLFALGAGKSIITKRSLVKSGMEIALIGIAASALCYIIGYSFSFFGI